MEASQRRRKTVTMRRVGKCNERRSNKKKKEKEKTEAKEAADGGVASRER